MFCAPGLVFGVTQGVGYRFLILRARTHLRLHRERRVPFSCFALPDSFSAVTSASGLIFMLCAPALIIGGTEGVGSRFYVFRSRTRFRRYRGRRVTFSCFACPDSFSAVPRASGPVFRFCAPRLIFDGSEVVEYRFTVFRARILFGRYLGCRVLFSCFTLPDSFQA
jgi:hypothetical protein